MEHCLKFNHEENNPITKVVEGDALKQKAQCSKKSEKCAILESSLGQLCTLFRAPISSYLC